MALNIQLNDLLKFFSRSIKCNRAKTLVRDIGDHEETTLFEMWLREHDYAGEMELHQALAFR